MGTAEVGTRPVRELLRREHPVGRDDGALAVDPLRLDRVQSGALDRQQAEDDADSAPLPGFHGLVMRAEPGADGLADVPRRVVPDQQQGRLAGRLQPVATPGQEVNAHGADRAAVNKAQEHLVPRWVVGAGAHAGQEPVARQGFGIGVVRGDGLTNQAQGRRGGLPAVQSRMRKPAPPDFVAEAEHPGRVLGRALDQSVASLFLPNTGGRGW